jgi:hypothetical protein
MTRATRLLAIAILGVTAMSASAQAPAKIDVSGKWAFTVQTDAGTGSPTVTLTQKGDSVTGHYSSQLLGERTLKGTVKDNKITFSFGSEVQGQAFTVTYTGTVESAESMKGTVDLGGAGSGTFTAKKQP